MQAARLRFYAWRPTFRRALVRSMGSRNGKRRAVVTGAAGGIGKAVAQRLLAEGVDVLAVDIDADAAARRCCRRLRDACRGPLRSRPARGARRRRPTGTTISSTRPASLKVKPILEVTVEEWRTIQTVNAESVFFLCQGIGAKLNPGGAIVNLSSSSAKLATSTDVAAYAASKTTILSITRSFAYALADRPVRVNAICPAIVDTPDAGDFLDGVARKRGIAAAELERSARRPCRSAARASAEECAGAIWFLLSDEAAT